MDRPGADVLQAAGVAPPASCQGQSLLPLARGEDGAPVRDWALCQYRNSGHGYDPPVLVTMLRHGTYKLVVHHDPPATTRERTGELYDLASDPDELDNRWDDDASTAVRSRLTELLLDGLVASEDRSRPRLSHW